MDHSGIVTAHASSYQTRETDDAFVAQLVRVDDLLDAERDWRAQEELLRVIEAIYDGRLAVTNQQPYHSWYREARIAAGTPLPRA